MSRRFLLKLLVRLDRSPLRLNDPVRRVLEREVLELLDPPTTIREIPAHVVTVHPDATGDLDTLVPS